MQSHYIGNNASVNITNKEFPTIAGIQNISNLIEKSEITN
jgi:hypothetical protein